MTSVIPIEVRKEDIYLKKMLQVNLIDEFLKKKTIAVVGVSRKKDIPANYILEKFKKEGYQAYAINPNADEIDGEKCYSSIAHVPEKPEAVLLAGTAQVSEKVIDQCAELKVPMVWMHRGVGKGSYSEAAEAKCRENGIAAITNGCPMMFVGKVDPFHRLIRWFKK